MPTDRDELTAALHQITAFAEGLLDLGDRLVRAIETDERSDRGGHSLAALDNFRNWLIREAA